MNAHGTDIPLPAAGVTAPAVRGRLFRKYVALFVGVVAVALLANGLFEIWFSYQEHEDSLIRIQREQAQAAGAKIEQFVQEIQNQIGWTTQLPWSAGTLEQRRFDALRLLRQVPAITELSQLDATGHEQLRVSRLAMDVVGSNADFSHDPKFTEAVAHKVYYGPVYFRRESEPYMTLALAGTRRDAGVSVAEVNLKFIWDVVSQIKVGEKGLAYVVDGNGRLIAHPDISLVLRNTDLSRLSQVRAARAGAAGEAAEPVRVARDVQGREVLTAAAPISPLGWFMFVELPISEAYAPLYASIERSAALLAAGLVLAFLAALLLARRMVVPIQALRAGAARLGGGDLGQRIAIKTGDELEALADQFNDMAGRLEESYADLEKKVDDRTKELTESLEQQTATSEVLGVISSSPGDLDSVFNSMLQNANRICGADFGVMVLYEDEFWRPVGLRSTPPKFAEWLLAEPRRWGPETALGRLEATKQLVQIDDVKAESVYHDRRDPSRVAFVELAGARTFVAVPMLKEDQLIGAFCIFRREVRPFTDKQIELVQNFAAQAVIAIENARLLSELRESLAQQTATAEVLQVISSSPGKLEPVFAAMLRSATTICGAKFAVLQLYRDDAFDAVAQFNVPKPFADYLAENRSRPPVPGTGLAQVVERRETVHIADIKATPAYATGIGFRRAAADLGDFRTLLIVPMLKDQTLVGAINIYRQDVQPFSDKQISLVESFASQAVIAIENARLLSELRESLAQQTATSEVLHTISSSPGELKPVFDAMLANALRLCEAHMGLMVMAEDGIFRPIAERGVPPEFAEFLHKLPPFKPPPGTSTYQMVQEKKTVHVPDAAATAGYREGVLLWKAFVDLGHARTSLFVPMIKEGEVVGAFQIYRPQVRPFTDKQVAVVESFASQAVIAIENARLLNEIRTARDTAEKALAELRTAQASLVQSEKMASLGQLTAGIAHEIKNPLNFVNNFAKLSVELLDELKETAAPGLAALDPGKREEVDELVTMLTGNLDKIGEHGRRADGIVKSMLAHSRGGSGDRQTVSINALIDESLNLAYHGVRAQDKDFNVTLERDFDSSLPPIEVVPQDITRVFLNLFGNGFYAVRQRQKRSNGAYKPVVKVTTREESGKVAIRIRDNGIGIPPDVRKKMFEPFFTTKPTGEGTGLGLSISYDIVTQQHGGSISVDSQVDDFTEFTIQLPRTQDAAAART
ncbi:MAG TPA: GAF domain-containing protein [Alphaproteobacteria bacterium]|nr:GAF domain-containing protein [Alphaproteobacteria bacterium]